MIAPVSLVVALVAAAVVAVAAWTGGPPGESLTAAYLLALTALFLVRVAGQVVVWRRAPSWLPPMEEWNLVPYRLLLPIQVAFLGAMAAIALTLSSVEKNGALGRALLAVAALYAGAMVVRYAVRMRRRPDQRWFGGAIPIVFHIVLAAFLATWARYHLG